MSHRVTVIQHRFVYIKGYSGFGLFGLFGAFGWAGLYCGLLER